MSKRSFIVKIYRNNGWGSISFDKYEAKEVVPKKQAK